jgi:PAS domain-containing protein
MDTMRNCELTEVDLRDCVPIVTAVMDAIEALIIILDTEARVVLFNHRCQEITGYSFDEAKGMYLWDLLSACGVGRSEICLRGAQCRAIPG